jgi:hypothetical protein
VGLALQWPVGGRGGLTTGFFWQLFLALSSRFVDWAGVTGFVRIDVTENSELRGRLPQAKPPQQGLTPPEEERGRSGFNGLGFQTDIRVDAFRPVSAQSCVLFVKEAWCRAILSLTSAHEPNRPRQDQHLSAQLSHVTTFVPVRLLS